MNFILRRVPEEPGKRGKWTAVISDTVFLWIFLACTGGWLADLLGLEVSLPAILAGSLPLAFLFVFFLYSRKKVRLLGLGITFLALLLIALVFSDLFVNGKNLLLNQTMDTIGRQFPYFLPEYPVTVAEGRELVTASLVYLWGLALLAYPGVYLVWSGNSILTAVLLAAPLAAQAVSGIYASLLWNLAGGAALLLIWLRRYGGKLPANRSRLAGLELTVVLAGGLALIFFLAQLARPVDRYEKNATAQAGKEGILSALDESRYGGDAQLLPEGDFRGLGSLKPQGKEALSVTMSQPESYYLRGFTGSKYVGTGWEDTDSEKRWESRDLFYWLHTDGYYGQEALALAAQALGSQEETYTIEIQNLGASSKYCYVPYELLDTSNDLLHLGDQKIGDEGLLTVGEEGSRSYHYQALTNQVIHYPTLAAKLLNQEELSQEEQDYQKLESYYNAYVYDTYLDVPVSIQSVLQDMLGEVTIEAGDKHGSYTQARQNILYALTADFTYSEELTSDWNGSDFIYEFLKINPTGYSVHYASAAVMMFRYYGIPARYVEGYLVTPSDVDNMTAGQPYTLDDSHAHAWVEYYQDGIGWLPFETTPSYLNVMERAEDFQDISGMSGEQTEEDQEEEENQEEEEDQAEEEKEIDWFQVLMVILLLLLIALLLLLLAFLIWVIWKRQQSKKAKKLFQDPDNRVAVRSLFTYCMNILSVSGLRIRNTSLYRYQRQIGKMFDPETAQAYREMVDIRQEAVYSRNAISEEQKDKLIAFKDQIWKRVYTNGSFFQKFQLKYIYYL